MRAIYTIGHSTLAIEAFIDRLDAHGVRQLADVRRFPRSRRHPHFSEAPLAVALAGRGIVYRHFEELGGHRPGRPDSPHVAWSRPFLRHYADHMESAGFCAALAELESWAMASSTAIMCAEARPESCHRQVLADALVRDGFSVTHILDVAARRAHRTPAFARIVGRRIVYDGGAMELGFPDPRGSGP